MNVREWALITFTILAQMSVGAFLVLGVVHFFAARKAGMQEADRLSDRALLAIGPALVLGLLASLFHLGSPLSAYRAVSNVGASWLSREVLAGVIFTVLGGLFAFMQWRKIGSFGLRNLIAWITALVGLVYVYSMAMVYLLPNQPAWNTVATPIAFFATALLLGALAMGAAFVANYAYVRDKTPDCADVQCILLRDALRWIAVAAIVLVGVQFVVLPLNVAYLASAGSAAEASVTMMVGPYGVVFGLRLALAFLGAGIIAMFLYQNAQSPGRERIMGNYAYAAFALVLIAEVLGRFLFYATHVGAGV
jgi:anaerobic dimethyl sulfoxide reductase subunit C (anchor subunit)